MGNRPQQNLFLLNGIEFTGAAENNMQPGGTSQQLLGVDAVREFNLLADSYSAEYGKRPGAQVLIVTQSGTNQLHGSIYEFLRNNAFDARNFFDGASVPGFERNQFGGAIGAPVKKNKTFLFANYEEFRQHLHQTGVDLVPDNNARDGFLPCALITPAPKPCPASGLAFVGISPLINSWPTPSAGAPDFGGISEAFNNPLQTIRDDFGTSRLDHVFSEKDTLNVVYTIDDSSDFTPTSTNLFSADAETLREQVASIEETHILSPNFLNTARVGFSRAAYFFTGEPTPGTPAASEPGFLSGLPLGAIVVGGSAASNPTAQLSLAGSNNGSNLRVARNLFTYEDRASFTKGRHQINIGAWFQRLRSNENLALSQYGQATFTSLQTLLSGTASTLLYDPSPTPLGWRSWFGAAYVEDVIRVNEHLALSLGFRDEFSTGWNEVHGRAATYTFTNSIISTQPNIGGSAFTVNNAKFLPQPRLGLAWSNSNDKRPTVIRAGFGMYNDLQDALGYRTDQNAPFNPTYSLPNLKVSSLPISLTAPIPSTAKLVPGGVQPNLQTPTLVSWSFRVQQALTANTSLTLGYVGSHGIHQSENLQELNPAQLASPTNPIWGVITENTVSNATLRVPYLGMSPTGMQYATSNGAEKFNSIQATVRKQLSHGLSFQAAYTYSRAFNDFEVASGSNYNNPLNLQQQYGLNTQYRPQRLVINYQYNLPGNNLKGMAGHLLGGWTLAGITTIQDGQPLVISDSRGGAIYGLSGSPSAALSGAEIAPGETYANLVSTGSLGQRLGGATLGPGYINTAALTTVPIIGATPGVAGTGGTGYGNMGIGPILGPGQFNFDATLGKTTRVGGIHENAVMQLRAEFFNLLNHPKFSNPATNDALGNFGQITSMSVNPRLMQLALKYVF